METPTRSNNAAWSSTEKELLEALLKDIFTLEEDPDVEQMSREETFRWLSKQFSARGFHRSAKAIAGRLAGRLSFRACRSAKIDTQHQSELLSTPGTDSLATGAQSRNLSTSSEDDIPLAQLRRPNTLLGTGSTFTDQSPSTNSAARRRKREPETLDSITVEPHTSSPQLLAPPLRSNSNTMLGSTLQPPATRSSPTRSVNTISAFASPFAPPQLTGTIIDDAQGKLWIHQKVQSLRERIRKRKVEKEEHINANRQRTRDRQSFREEMRKKEVEAESLTRRLQELQSRCEEIKSQQREIDEAEKAQERIIEDIEGVITKDEEELKLYSAVARL